MRFRLLLLGTVLAFGACAAPIPEALVPISAPVAAVVAPQIRPKLWYLGLGMQGETWSENDVVEVADRLQRVAPGFEVMPMLLSNRIAGMPERYPGVDGRSVEDAVASIAASAGPDDLVMVYVSTHRAPELLGVGARGRPLPSIGVRAVQRWLAPLQGHDTVLVLSACFSGSFIPALKDAHRIIFTAARADRTSFGCQAGAEHTVFGAAFLDALTPDASLHAVVDRTRAAVRRREHEMRVSDPSLPQISVGSDVSRLYETPLF